MLSFCLGTGTGNDFHWENLSETSQPLEITM